MVGKKELNMEKKTVRIQIELDIEVPGDFTASYIATHLASRCSQYLSDARIPCASSDTRIIAYQCNPSRRVL
jgi:hypothetical protein